MRFEISGEFRTIEVWQTFRKIVKAHNERFAVEKIYSLIGTNHKVNGYCINGTA